MSFSLFPFATFPPFNISFAFTTSISDHFFSMPSFTPTFFLPSRHIPLIHRQSRRQWKVTSGLWKEQEWTVVSHFIAS